MQNKLTYNRNFTVINIKPTNITATCNRTMLTLACPDFFFFRLRAKGPYKTRGSITTDFFDLQLFKSKRPWKRFQDFRQSYR